MQCKWGMIFMNVSNKLKYWLIWLESLTLLEKKWQRGFPHQHITCGSTQKGLESNIVCPTSFWDDLWRHFDICIFENKYLKSCHLNGYNTCTSSGKHNCSRIARELFILFVSIRTQTDAQADARASSSMHLEGNGVDRNKQKKADGKVTFKKEMCTTCHSARWTTSEHRSVNRHTAPSHRPMHSRGFHPSTPEKPTKRRENFPNFPTRIEMRPAAAHALDASRFIKR